MVDIHSHIIPHIDDGSSCTRESLKLLEELKSQGKTILFSSHNPNHALVLNGNACMIKDGKVIASGVASSCITQENLCALYGNNVVLKATNDCNVCALSLV